jgi:hypothetical protein
VVDARPVGNGREDLVDDHVVRPTSTLTAARTQREALQRAMVRLEGAAAAPARHREGPWEAIVTEALHEVRRALAEHVHVAEGPDGLFNEIRGLHPRFEHRVHELAKDHIALADLIDRAASALQAADPLDIDACREAVTILLTRLMRHRQRGLDLVYEAYQLDVGAGD